MNPPSPAISLNGVTKVFGRTAALRGITAEFRSGRIHVLLGGNGAGKTTLLRVIAGLIGPTHGTVITQGSIGYMAHASMLYDELTALENLQYFATLYGVPRQRCTDVIEAVGLDPQDSRFVREYSQGMRQRLSLARALVHDPEILLFDEPFSNVDAASAAKMTALLARLRDHGHCVIVVTHQPSLLQEVTDEFLAMGAGRITSQHTTLAETRR